MKEQFLTLPMSSIKRDPRNPRPEPTEAEVSELAEDIKRNGLTHPPTVRVESKQAFDGAGSSTPEELKSMEFILGPGQRRVAALRLLGNEDVLCRVVDCDADRFLDMMLSENIARSDMHPLDIAAHLQGRLRGRATTKTIAAKIGQKEEWVKGQLRLLNLGDRAQAMFRAGTISHEQAARLAELSHDLQGKVLDAKVAAGHDEIERLHCSDRELAEVIKKLSMQLEDAHFDIEDTTLYPEAGACSACPKRSDGGNSLFAEFACKKSSCLDRACWGVKLTTHRQREVAAAIDHFGGAPYHNNLYENSYYGEEIPEGMTQIGKTWKEIDLTAASCEHVVLGTYANPKIWKYKDGKTYAYCTDQACGVHKRQSWELSGNNQGQKKKPSDESEAEASRRKYRQWLQTSSETTLAETWQDMLDEARTIILNGIGDPFEITGRIAPEIAATVIEMASSKALFAAMIDVCKALGLDTGGKFTKAEAGWYGTIGSHIYDEDKREKLAEGSWEIQLAEAIEHHFCKVVELAGLLKSHEELMSGSRRKQLPRFMQAVKRLGVDTEKIANKHDLILEARKTEKLAGVERLEAAEKSVADRIVRLLAIPAGTPMQMEDDEVLLAVVHGRKEDLYGGLDAGQLKRAVKLLNRPCKSGLSEEAMAEMIESILEWYADRRGQKKEPAGDDDYWSEEE